MSIISCKGISIKYDGGFAVKDVSFELMQGDYLYIVGENGSGKSTLMKGILGLLKPANGQIIFNGLKQKEIGYLPQQTVVQKDFPASVYEVVLSGCLNRHGFMPFYSKKDRENAKNNIKHLGIEAFKKKSYRDLSGGQQQRVLLARALCATDKLLMLDEPVSGLDPVVSSEMYSLLYKLNHEHGITIIMISHDIQSAVQYGNKILHMQTSPLFFGSTMEYMNTNIGIRMMGGVENA
ncbi:metal ABC transporter ATP-binding protein [Acetivibrio cellulolyticus]|uniref:metal ABC transporter ATP-binding protein n=1 Tax=Acetivibrio cellulolyticus TaxID=35830 RepID=UPI0002481C00|nr:metal ABC transporter ATP-binding protein [Acetivibrio cellulolyticus]